MNSTTKKVTFDLNIKVYEDIWGDSGERNDESDHEKKEETQTETLVESGLIKTCPSKHRYTNCELNDEDECENTQLESSDRNNEERHQSLVQEESSESLFSLSIGSKTGVSSNVETGDKEVISPLSIQGSNQNARDRSHYVHHVPSSVEMDDKEVNSPISIRGSNQNARDRSRYVHHVLNPVENLTQWKEIKARARPSTSKHQAKENISLEDKLKLPRSPEPSFKVSSLNFKPNSNDSKCFGEETTVETSLSSWLNESEMTPNCRSGSISVGNSSPNSLEDRLASTVKEIKHFSASSFPNGSQCRSMEENPRTIGSYWSHTGQELGSTDSASSCHGVPNTTSKYREVLSLSYRRSYFS